MGRVKVCPSWGWTTGKKSKRLRWSVVVAAWRFGYAFGRLREVLWMSRHGGKEAGK